MSLDSSTGLEYVIWSDKSKLALTKIVCQELYVIVPEIVAQ